METVRCKFRCVSVTKYVSGWEDHPVHYNYKFSVVSSGSEENKKFFAATPSGEITLSALKDDLFDIGQYYVDFTPAAEQ